MKALIDGDIIVYRVGYTTENDEEWVAKARADEMIANMLATTKAKEYTIYLSDSANNFRLKLYPAYKANRVQPKPKHYQFLKDYLLNDYNTEITTGQEADDALGIEQTRYSKDDSDNFELFNFKSVICSIDKDLLQVPGLHYNFVKGEFIEQTYFSGIKNFWSQVLQGDRTDNIPGITGIGPKTADKLLSSCQSETDMFLVAKEQYINFYGEEQWKAAMQLVGPLLWIRRVENETWSLPEVEEQSRTSSEGEIEFLFG